MQLAVLAICLAASSFLPRVLVALLKESIASIPLLVNGYLARFVPSRK